MLIFSFYPIQYGNEHKFSSCVQNRIALDRIHWKKEGNSSILHICTAFPRRMSRIAYKSQCCLNNEIEMNE